MTADPYQIKYDDLIKFIGQLYEAHQKTRKELKNTQEVLLAVQLEVRVLETKVDILEASK